MSLVDRWRQEGLEEGLLKGLEKGREEGKAEGLAETTILLLTQKFGTVPLDMKEHITKMDAASLKILFINIFNFTKIEEVKYYLK
ncbi:DUF4351 domain-containing protein [Lysinibacillus sp. FSL H8-0500]|uniref:DUF4351 domain-containing protein n=1 Tax=Lysinibacillus sp. FSL H8-0500 TaxID=2921393 RepID=UPI00310164D9